MNQERADKPWGAYIVLDEGEHFKVKRIEVQPGHRLSYQRHEHRAEHWFVVSGHALVDVETAQRDLVPGETIDIPIGAAHRVSNPEEGTLIFIEIQTGDYLGEDDIQRLDDDYGRIGA